MTSDFLGEAGSVAEYVSGSIRVYDVEVTAYRLQSELALSHEEFHHMLRLKSSFGLYLTSLLERIAKKEIFPHPVVLQTLCSRYRTSDEVIATFNSVTMASWCHGRDAVLEVLSRHPTYYMYFEAGQSLTYGTDHPFLSAASLEAIIRFCWSPEVSLWPESGPLENIYSVLPPEQFPDRRLQELQMTWSKQEWEELASEVLPKGLRWIFNRPYAQLIDPSYDLIEYVKSQNSIFVSAPDSEAKRYGNMRGRKDFLSTLAAACVWNGYRYLYRRYKGTTLEAMCPTKLIELMDKMSRERNTGKGELVETLITRSSRRKAVADTELPFRPWEGNLSDSRYRIAPFCVRPISKLSDQLDLQLPLNSSPDDTLRGNWSVYAVHAGWDVSLDPLELRMHQKAGWPELANDLVRDKPIGPLVLWSADLSLDMDSVRAVAANTPVWFVCDTSPLELIETLKKQGCEVLGVTAASRVPGCNLSALVASIVQRDGHISGVIFPGSLVQCGKVSRMLWEVLGDNCRGVDVSFPIMDGHLQYRMRVGRVVLDLISITDRWFTMAERGTH
jgi:hypothetical protein